MTPEELKAQLGIEFQPGALDALTQASGLAGSQPAWCAWNPTDPSVFVSVSLLIRAYGDEAEARFDSDGAQAGAKPAPGVSDEAVQHIGDTGTNSLLSFIGRPWHVELSMSGAEWQPTEAQLTEVARIAVSRL